MVFQNYALYPHMTVYENMAFSLKLRHVPKAEIDKKVKEAAEILDIPQYLLGVRPEHTDVAEEGVAARVDVAEMMGSSVHLHVNAEGHDVIIIVPTVDMKGNYEMGDTVHFSFDGKVAHVFSKETEKNLEF